VGMWFLKCSVVGWNVQKSHVGGMVILKLSYVNEMWDFEIA